MERAMNLDTAITATLAGIHDPCSVAAGRPTSLADMGLVRGWTLEAGTLTVTFAVTFAGCTMAPHFIEAARTALLTLPDVAQVVTIVDTEFIWTPDLMAASPALVGEPQAWRKRALSLS
jgi:metal-sulfur cluster biosynthetic enzyme